MSTSNASSNDTDYGEESNGSIESILSSDEQFEESPIYRSSNPRNRYYKEVTFEKYTMKSDILRKMVKVLKGSNETRSTESYFTDGNISSDDVSLEIAGVGKITLPIPCDTATKLKDMATLASFGHGEKTKQDQNVRDTYMISKEKLNVMIRNLDEILKVIKTKLSLNEDSSLEACLHNMLIYEKGQHFDFHQDTEKMNNMVATMVISLPSAHIGGNLIIKQLNKSHVFSTEMINGDDVKYIAFYSDCYHKVEKVKEGFRIVLTYNLILCNSQFKPNICGNRKLISVLRKYFKKENKDSKPKKLIYLFDHCYTKKEIKFSNLKGFDVEAASALVSAAKELNLVLRLALADIQEQWDGEDGDLMDMEVKLESWRDEKDQPLKYGTYIASQEDICWIKHNNDLKPYNVENSGYTGNEGITEDRWYKRAAVILWPQSSDFAVQLEFNYARELNKLKTLLESPENMKCVEDFIEKAGTNLFLGLNGNDDDKEIIKTFVKLAIYMKDSKKALKICQHFCCHLLYRNSNFLFELKDVYGSSWCLQLMIESGISKEFSYTLNEFVTALKENDCTLTKQILKDQIESVGQGHNLHSYSILVKATYETKCFDLLNDIFKAITSQVRDTQELAQFYIEYCMNIEKDLVQTLKEPLVISLQKNIKRYRESYNKYLQWLSKVNFGNCRCELCNDMINFLKKGDFDVKPFAVNKQKRQHLLTCFEIQNKNSFAMIVDQRHRPYQLVVVKKIHFIDGLEGKLAESEKQLKCITEADVGKDRASESNLVKRSIQKDATETSVKKQCL